MPTNCLLPSQAEKLKEAFKSKKISFEALYNMTSDQRLDYFKNFLDDNNAKIFTVKLEKGFLAPNQVEAMKKITEEIAQRGKLYRGIKIAEAERMRKELNIKELEQMSYSKRAEIFARYIENKKVVKKINQTFRYYKTLGDLAKWEERAFGNTELAKEKAMKGNVQRIEALEKMGVLNPKQAETFMKNYVEDSLGVALTLEQSQKLSELTRKEMELFDELVKSGDIDMLNENMANYLKAVHEIAVFENSVTDRTASDLANILIHYTRGAILASPRMIRNSGLYQMIPTMERLFTTTTLSPALFNKEINASVSEMFKAKVFSLTKSKETLSFIKKQVISGFKIYKDTGFEVSRMTTLDDGRNMFGGEKLASRSLVDYDVAMEKSFLGKFKKAIKSENKIRNNIGIFIDAVTKTPKWTAGGTDMVVGNAIRAFSSLHNAYQIAHIESSRKQFENKTEREAWIDKRMNELVLDSWRFDPKTNQGKIIREGSIGDAHLANSTQDSFFADKTKEIRNIFGKKIKIGTLIMPFIKIPATVTQKGVEATLLPATILYRLNKMRKISKITDDVKRTVEMQKQLSYIIQSVGLFGAAFLLFLNTDDEDYTEPYIKMTRGEYARAEALERNPSSVNLFGMQVDFRFLPGVNIPLMALLQGRRNYLNRKDPDKLISSFLLSYIVSIWSSVFTNLSEMPGISETYDIIKKIDAGAKSDDLEKMLWSLGFDGQKLLAWAKVRILPSIVSYDLMRMMYPPDVKYNFLGEPVSREKDIFGLRQSKTNDIVIEYARLDNNGYAPTISEPNTKYTKELKEKMGEKKYQDFLAELQRDYASKVEEYLGSNWYDKKSDEDKKKALDKLRTKHILEVLERENKYY